MLFLDLDRFKVVNDSLGHHAGDQLLQSVALRLDAALRPGDTVARMGGDEFTVLLEDVTDPREATVVAERVLATLADPFPIAGRELHVSGSIGIALGGPDVDPEELIRDADVAMYRAKAEGKARHAVFDAHMHRHVLARLDLETDLRRAIETETLQVLFQPIMRTVSGEVTGFEALCRWEVEPREFVAMAEETGLIVPLGRFVLREAARRAAEWDACVCVNVSGRQLADPDFTRTVEQALARVRRAAGEPAPGGHRVGDDAGPGGARCARSTDLRTRVGVSAHLDDFGTGASSLRFLHRFPGDALKIDRGLVIDMLTDPGSHEIVKAIVGLAHNLGMEVVGEGVETAEHLEKLRVLGCELAQGFHLSAPLTAEAAAHLLAPAAGRRAGPDGAAEAGAPELARSAGGRSRARPRSSRLRSKRSSRMRSSSVWPSRSASAVLRSGPATSAKRSRSESSISSSSAMPRSCISARSCSLLASARSRCAACSAMRALLLGLLGGALTLRRDLAMLARDGLAARMQLALGLLADEQRCACAGASRAGR